jgi:hypothetical protein
MVTVQILQTSGSDSPTTFSANGMALCLGDETVTVTVVLVPQDFSTDPVSQGAELTTIDGLAGFNEWTADFDGEADLIPDVPFVMYALAYDSTGTLVAEANQTISDLGDGVQRLPSKKKTKKKPKKVAKSKKAVKRSK